MRSLLLLFILAATSICNADYFDDQGYVDAEYRSDYNSSSEGTSSNQLSYVSCQYPMPNQWLNCPSAPKKFGEVTPLPSGVASPIYYASSSSVWNQNAEYWVLCSNDEPAFVQTDPNASEHNTKNYGIPCISNELYSNTSSDFTKTPTSFASVYGSIVGENFSRAHLIVRHMGRDPSGQSQWPDSYGENGPNGLPFMSIGAHENRGNSSEVGAINSTTRPHTVKFKARIWDIIEPVGDPDYHSGAAALWFYMFVITEWDNEDRGIFLTLKHIGDGSGHSTGVNDGNSLDWNWNIAESFFKPGVNFAFIDSEDLQQTSPYPPFAAGHCFINVPQIASTGVDYSFTINLDELFRCVDARGLFSTDMPTSTVLPIKGVHWAVEMVGSEGAIWVSVHDMKMQ